MKQIVIIIAIISLVAAGTGGAQTSLPPGAKDPETAKSMSIGGTLAPCMLALLAGSDADNTSYAYAGLAAGLVVGPSLGHLYAGNKIRLLTGLAIRTACFAGAVLGENSADGDTRDGQSVFVVGLLISVAADIRAADDSARKYNKEHGLAGVKVSPTYFASQEAFGVQVTIGL